MWFTKYILPGTFIYLDSQGYIYSKDNTYYITKQADEKAILYRIDVNYVNNSWKYNYKLFKIDQSDSHRRDIKRCRPYE